MPDVRRWRSTALGPGRKRVYPLAADLAARGEGQAALRATATGTDHAAAVRLAGAIWPLLGWRGCYEEQLTAARLGVRAARASGEMVTEPRLHAGMGSALRHLGRPGEADGCLRRAARLWLGAGRDGHLAAVLRELGHLPAAPGRPAKAIRYLTGALGLSAPASQEPGGLAAFPSSVNGRAIDGGEPPTGAGRI